MRWVTDPWPWYVAGPLIGLFVPALLLVGNKQLGVSSALRAMCAAVLPAHVQFFKYDWRATAGWNLAFVTGIFLGGFIAATLLGPVAELAPASVFSWSMLLTVRGATAVLLGGFLVGLGASYAGGCTSGHGITGLASLQLPSLIALLAMFAGGLLATYTLIPLVFSRALR